MEIDGDYRGAETMEIKFSGVRTDPAYVDEG